VREQKKRRRKRREIFKEGNISFAEERKGGEVIGGKYLEKGNILFAGVKEKKANIWKR